MRKSGGVVLLFFLTLVAASGWFGWRWFAGLDGADAILIPDGRAYSRPDPTAYQRFLTAVVDDRGRVDYTKAVGTVRSDLDTYLEQAASATPAVFDDDSQRLAFFINAYNASVIAGVLHHWPIDSIDEVGPLHQFFRDRDYRIAGSTVSLHGFESRVIRRFDPRLHFALICASASCPPMSREAYVAETLERQLESAAVAFIRDRRFNRYEPEEHTWYLSSIFKWYADDFGGEAQVRQMLRRYVTVTRHEPAHIVYLDYDWSLNTPETEPAL
ncbi:DUF547 domain-containing protein [Sulfidibacter corallicola]|uniref:DUF547 domain-containing protein n=1 Tax=Sulfidibacter corallicola TaxID=2818388 RepID=A0A8A4TQ83_SULCO|nr:DUF547 domain-containing protein [Sulfidibacter corallicola]QTD51344.1 DUF547 domain-containing protein [Sulfidibacter corallicola]